MVGLSSIVDIGRDKHKHEISPAPVCLVSLVYLVQPNKPNRPNRPNEQDGIARSLTGRWPRPYNAVVTCESS
jgi:hypothetical protein